jgi:hypothetical protein
MSEINRNNNEIEHAAHIELTEEEITVMEAERQAAISTKIAPFNEVRRAVQIFVREYAKSDAASDSDLMEIPRIYPTYDDFIRTGQKIKAGIVIRDGVNAVGDPQLYRTVLDTMPREDMRPAKIATSFIPVGLGTSGYPIWVQPLWYLDAYDLGDKVDVGGSVYVSTKEGNMTNPLTESSAWEVWTGEDQPPAEVERNSNGTEKWADWVDPKGVATSYYNTGDGVTYNGVRKVSTHDNNGFAPNVMTSWDNA